MPDQFPYLQDGDPLEPWHFNILFDECRRWKKLQGVMPVAVQGVEGDGPPIIELVETPPIFAQITAAYSGGYAWQEVLIGPNRTISLSGLTGSPATGDPAFERQAGDTTLTADGTVYEMRRSPASAQWLFDGKN